MTITVQRIFDLMKEKGYTQTYLTENVPLTQGLLSQWKKGLQNPSQDNIVKLAKFFGVSTDYLLGNTDYRTLDEAGESFKIKAANAVESFTEWLEDHGYEVGRNESDNGSGGEWYITKGEVSHFFEENEFENVCVDLVRQTSCPEDVIYTQYIVSLFYPNSSLNDDERELLDIFRSLNRSAIHELMAKAYELRDRVEKEKTQSATETA